MSKTVNKNEVTPRAGDNVVSLSSLIPIELAAVGDEFVPCPKTLAWIRSTFLDPSSRLYNVEHDHLNSASIGLLWTNAENTRHGKRIVGTAELATAPPSLSKWAKARWAQQLREWFGDEPLDFLITLFAPYFASIEPIEQCADAEHELYHCAQKADIFGIPKFRKDGRPVFTIRGHDFEGFTGIMRRYGPTADEAAAFANAAGARPEFSRADFAGMCGACQ